MQRLHPEPAAEFDDCITALSRRTSHGPRSWRVTILTYIRIAKIGATVRR
jgi:hypothetical protein